MEPTNEHTSFMWTAATPNCTTTLPSSRIVTVGAYYTAECIVNFKASDGIAPFISWSGTGDFTQATMRTNSSTWSGMAFYVQIAQDGKAFTGLTNFTAEGFGGVDTSTNVPTWQYTYSTGLLFVQCAYTLMFAQIFFVHLFDCEYRDYTVKNNTKSRYILLQHFCLFQRLPI